MNKPKITGDGGQARRRGEFGLSRLCHGSWCIHWCATGEGGQTRTIGKNIERYFGELDIREEIKDIGRRGRFMKAVQGQFDGSSVRSTSNILANPSQGVYSTRKKAKK